MNWNNVLEEYNNIIKNDNYNNITKIYCLYCVEESLKWLEKDLIETEDNKINMAQVVYDYWLDTDIQISKLSDIICKYWKDYEKDVDFDVYEYMERLENESYE